MMTSKVHHQHKKSNQIHAVQRHESTKLTQSKSYAAQHSINNQNSTK
jgi:hypothetical protein